MQLEIEIGVMMALYAYAAQKEKNNVDTPYFPEIVEKIRRQYFTSYEEYEFLGIISKMRQYVKRSGISSWVFEQKKLDLSWEKISELFYKKFKKKAQKTISFDITTSTPKQNYESNSLELDKALAWKHFHEVGEIANEDVLSQYELKLIKL